jgi:hypothetical protein
LLHSGKPDVNPGDQLKTIAFGEWAGSQMSERGSGKLILEVEIISTG